MERRQTASKILFTAAMIFSSSVAQSATATYSLGDFLAAIRRTGIKDKLEHAIAEQTAARTAATQQALGSWTSALESEVGLRPEDERKVSIGLSRKFTFGADSGLIERRFAKEGEADFLAESVEIRDQELQVAKLYIKLRLEKALADTARTTQVRLEPLVKSIEDAARRGSIGYLAAVRSRLSLDEVSAGLGAATANYDSLAKWTRSVLGLAFSSNPSDVEMSALSGSISSGEFSPDGYAPYKENLLRQDALSSEASLVSSRREIDATLGLSREVRTSATSVIVGVEIPIMTGDVVSSRTREVQASRSLLTAKADLIAAKGRQQFQLLRSEAQAARDRIERLDQRSREIGALTEKVQGGFKRGQVEAEAVTESLVKQYEVSVQKLQAMAEYENFMAEMWTLTGELSNAK